MKRTLFAIILACCTLTMAAQEGGIRVKYQGAKPSISDFVNTYLNSRSEGDDDCSDESFNAVQQAWNNKRAGKALRGGETLTIDSKNGFVLYESRYDNQLLRVEMCYWNEADQKHKLFAYNVACFTNGKYSPGQFDGLTFLRYDNATKRMSWCEAPGFDAVMGNEDGSWISYSLPRTGKDITVTTWLKNGKQQQTTLKFNGRKFNY